MHYFEPQLETKQNDYLHEPLEFPNAISSEQCDAWIKALMESDIQIFKGDLQGDEEDEDEEGRGLVDPTIRIVEKREFYTFDDYPIVDEITAELEAIFTSANELFNFDIHGIDESINLLRYTQFPEGGGHYVGHTDFGPDILSTRKLTCIIQLTDPSEYDGCRLVLPDYDEPVSVEKGTAIVFPSYMYHLVEPLTRGQRFCINAWCAGPAFR